MPVSGIVPITDNLVKYWRVEKRQQGKSVRIKLDISILHPLPSTSSQAQHTLEINKHSKLPQFKENPYTVVLSMENTLDTAKYEPKSKKSLYCHRSDCIINYVKVT